MKTAKPKGFRYLKLHNPAKLTKISRKGGKTSQSGPNAKHWTEDEARAQGRRGAAARWKTRTDKTDTKTDTKGAA